MQKLALSTIAFVIFSLLMTDPSCLAQSPQKKSAISSIDVDKKIGNIERNIERKRATKQGLLAAKQALQYELTSKYPIASKEELEKGLAYLRAVSKLTDEASKLDADLLKQYKELKAEKNADKRARLLSKIAATKQQISLKEEALEADIALDDEVDYLIDETVETISSAQAERKLPKLRQKIDRKIKKINDFRIKNIDLLVQKLLDWKRAAEFELKSTTPMANKETVQKGLEAIVTLQKLEGDLKLSYTELVAKYEKLSADLTNMKLRNNIRELKRKIDVTLKKIEGNVEAIPIAILVRSDRLKQNKLNKHKRTPSE